MPTILINEIGSTWFRVPEGVTSLIIECIGGGGGGGVANVSYRGGGGGAGGGYAKKTISIEPLAALEVVVGAGGAGRATPGTGGTGGDSWALSTSTVIGKGGAGGSLSTRGIAPTTNIGDVVYRGGYGGSGSLDTAASGGGGGAANDDAIGGTGGSGDLGGAAGISVNGYGGAGGEDDGNNGIQFGGGGGGALYGYSSGSGAQGCVRITYNEPAPILSGVYRWLWTGGYNYYKWVACPVLVHNGTTWVEAEVIPPD